MRGSTLEKWDVIMAYQMIINKLHIVGFDEYYQAGSTSIFHPLNIVAKSKILDKQYWICVDGGYRCPTSYYIAHRDLSNTHAPTKRIKCKNQSEIVEQLDKIQSEIKNIINIEKASELHNSGVAKSSE